MKGREENLGVVEVNIDGTVGDTLKGDEEGVEEEDGEEEGAEVGIGETVMLTMRDMMIGIQYKETAMGNMMNMKMNLLIMI